MVSTIIINLTFFQRSFNPNSKNFCQSFDPRLENLEFFELGLKIWLENSLWFCQNKIRVLRNFCPSTEPSNSEHSAIVGSEHSVLENTTNYPMAINAFLNLLPITLIWAIEVSGGEK